MKLKPTVAIAVGQVDSVHHLISLDLKEHHFEIEITENTLEFFYRNRKTNQLDSDENAIPFLELFKD